MKWMKHALKLAEQAASLDEVPVGAVIVLERDPQTGAELSEPQLISEAFNNRESAQNPVGHAELLAIQRAAQKLGRWRLSGCTLYVTLKPCVMCNGAIMLSRLDKVIYGAKDLRSGAGNHQAMVQGGVCAEECSQLLKDFFAKKR